MSYEFPNDSAEDMDEAAVRILRRNMAAGRREEASSFSPAGIPHQALWDRAKAELQRFNETGELPPAWEPEPTEAPEIDDEAFAEAMRELEAIEIGCVEPPPLGWLCQLSRYGEP